MADAKHQRVIPIDDTELFALITEKGQLVDAGRSISREMEALVEQHEKLNKELESLAGKVGTIARRIFKRVKKAAEGQIEEWEMPITTELRDGKPVLILSNALEQFKEEFKAQDKFKEMPLPTKRGLAAKK